MSYMALARKWRPRTFSQMLGQDHINKALINALDQQRLHHAYLFTGTRGVGKTSVARILAKALNCEQGISSKPCLVCDTCMAIEQGRFMDLIEIDGASKTRVEDIRDLLDNVHYAPASGRYKVYLIDEVHMLSQHSFNALLKTLEEPPAHIIFILATTDPQKVPVTVLSRCLQFHLKHLADEVIDQHLQQILQDEQLEFEPQALALLARAARGSMRDALSLLDQAITSCNQKLLTADVKMLLGYTQQDYALQILQQVAAQNPEALLQLNQQIAQEGQHYHYVLDEMLHYLHEMAVLQSIGTTNPLISPSEDLKILAQNISAEDVQLFYQIALKSRDDMELAPSLSIGFSMTLLRMLTFRPAAKAPTPAVPAPTGASAAPAATTVPITKPSTPIQQTSNWTEIIPQLKLTGFALTALEHTEFVAKEGRELSLRVAKGHQSLFTPTTITRVETALTEYYQAPIKIIISSENAIKDSLAQKKMQVNQQNQQDAEESLHNDPIFQQIKNDFSAELVKNSIALLKDDI